MRIAKYKLLLCLLLLAGLAWSFLQYFHMPLDGDMAGIILPGPHYSRVLNDPFGLSALLHGERYSAPNRFFAHGFMALYFKTVPAGLQQFASPIDSVYLACALLKTGVHLLIGLMLAAFISGSARPLQPGFLLAAMLVFPFFQNTAYQGTMGIIDPSVTYTCFYALPMAVLLLFFRPFQRALQAEGRLDMPLWQKILWAVLAVALAFSGPVVLPAVLLASALVAVYFWKKTAGTALGNRVAQTIRQIPATWKFYLVFFSLLCLYSLYIGTFNAENNNSVDLAERYARLPEGLLNQFSMRLGLPLLLLGVLANAVLLKKQSGNPEAARTLRMLQWLAVFSLIYIFLLPLGGYREYRPDIVRRDTILPVLLCLVYGFGLSTYLLLRQFQGKFKITYRVAVALFLAIFVNANLSLPDQNRCERAALEKIARSPEKIVRLNDGCTVLAWVKISNYRESDLQGQLLQLWGVTGERRYYFQE
jgi:hypothetical protein